MAPELIGLLAGLGLAGGIILFVMSFQPPPEKVARPQLRARARGTLAQRLGLAGPDGARRLRNLAIGTALGVAVSFFSRTLIFLPIFAAGGVLLPDLLSGGKKTGIVARSEALETWTRSMAGVLISGIGLEVRSARPCRPRRQPSGWRWGVSWRASRPARQSSPRCAHGRTR